MDPGVQHDGLAWCGLQRWHVAVKVKADEQSSGAGGAGFEEAAAIHVVRGKTHCVPPAAGLPRSNLPEIVWP